jgi:hypothetical protein
MIASVRSAWINSGRAFNGANPYRTARAAGMSKLAFMRRPYPHARGNTDGQRLNG